VASASPVVGFDKGEKICFGTGETISDPDLPFKGDSIVLGGNKRSLGALPGLRCRVKSSPLGSTAFKSRSLQGDLSGETGEVGDDDNLRIDFDGGLSMPGFSKTVYES